MNNDDQSGGVMNKSFWRGMATMLLLVIVAILGGCNITIAGVTVWRSPAGQIADALHRLNGDESHAGRRD